MCTSWVVSVHLFFYVSSDLVTSIGWAGMTLTRRTHGCGPGLGTGSAAEVSVPTFWFLHGVGWTTHSPQGKRIASHGLSPSYPGTSLVGSDVDILKFVDRTPPKISSKVWNTNILQSAIYVHSLFFRGGSRTSAGWHSDSCCNNIRFICELDS